MSTPKENDNSPKKTFSLKSDKNRSFTFDIQNKKSSIYIYAFTQTEIQKNEFSKDFSLKDLKENKYLSLFDSIDEIYDEIINFISTKSSEIKIKEEQNIIIINIPIGGLKIKEILLTLNEKEKDEKQQINDLFNIIYNLKQENNDLKTNIKNLEERLKKMEKLEERVKNTEKLEERIKYLESFINDINSWKEYKVKVDKKEKENKLIRNLDSKVIGENENYNKSLKNWINPNLKIKAELLYRLSRDGKEYQTFHKLCDNKGPTLTIFQLTDGNILGGYTTKDWDSSNSWKKDQNAFNFSLTENVKCIPDSNQGYIAIYSNNSYGPHFNAISFQNNKKMDEPLIQEGSYYPDSKKLYPGKTGNYYKAQELEVFKIIIN